MKMISVAAALFCIGAPATASVTISNIPTGSSTTSLSQWNSTTYGQVFTAPLTGRLSSFTLHLNGPVGAIRGGVGTWNGTPTFASGYGSPINLYLSSDAPSLAAGAFQFTPNVAVTAGQLYVAYLTLYGVAGASGTTTMPLGTSVPGLNYLVWNYGGNPAGDPSWDYPHAYLAAQFSATFVEGSVPEPASWAMLIAGFGLTGALQRRSRAVIATV